MRARLAIALMLAGCTPAAVAPWVPSLVVRGQVVRRESDASRGARSRWDWVAGLDLRWSAVRSGVIEVEPAPRPDRPPERSSACADASLCAWEQRSRARALGRWESTR